MGNQHGKRSDQTQFSSEELKVLEAAFRAAAGHSDKLPKERLETWSSIIDGHLVHCTANFLFTYGKERYSFITLPQFAAPYFIVERGSMDEKLNFLAGSLEKTDSSQVAIKELEKYVTAVFRSYISMITQQGNDAFSSWKRLGYQSSDRSILGFSKGIIRQLTVDNEHRVNVDKLERWLQVNPTFLIIWREVFANLYTKQAGKPQRLGSPIDAHILPTCEGVPGGMNYSPILDIPHLMYINSNLPNEKRHKWRFLFSSKIMGESFSTMLGKILNKGSTLLVIEDEDRYIFGGYAPESWALRPGFVGDDSSMLMTLSPAMRCFSATGYNNHFQYLNLNQQTLPNGLGMGGQFQYWGLWLDSDYGLGQSSESCTTYRDYFQLSKRKEFKIRNIEIWGIGDEPKNEDDSDEEGETKKRSVLDKNLEDRVMLELAGRQMNSEGLREPDLE